MTREAQFIDKQDLIKAIEDATVTVLVNKSTVYDKEWGFRKTVMKTADVIDAHKLLEALKK